MDKSDISVDFNNNILTIAASHSEDNKEENDEGVIIHRERHTSSVKRQFSFNDVRRDNIEASYDKGVLHITLPKNQNENDSSSRITIN